MRINIARQPFVPAFLTLLTLATIAACMLGTGSPANAYLWSTEAAESVGFTTPKLILAPTDAFIAAFQAGHPIWSRILAGTMILLTGMSIGRLTVRYNLYSVSTCLAIPLFGTIIIILGPSPHYLVGVTSATLAALATKNLARACINGYGFDALFRAALYLGLMVLIVPAALPMLLMLPLGILLFRRTQREAVVALAGLVLAPLTICYINWGAGGTFTAPIVQFWETFMQSSPLVFFTTQPLIRLALAAGIGLLTLLSIFFFWNNAYAVGNKPRNILIMNIGAFFFSAATLFMPSASAGNAVLVAIPAAILMPVLFVRIHRSIALLLYLLLLASAIASIYLQ